MHNGKTGEMGRRGNWRNATEPDGTPRSTNRRALTPQIHFFASSYFDPLVISSPPFPNTQRFGGFETTGIGRQLEYRSEEKGRRAKWTTAALGGDPRNHGKQ